MIIGLATLLLMLFGVSSAETLYVDVIDSNASKYITDKDRLKDMKTDLKAYEKSLKTFNKRISKSRKLLKKQNLDYNTPITWYSEFFEEEMKARAKLQGHFINERMHIQEKIYDDEWQQIMDVAVKDELKRQEKELNKKEKDKFNAINEAIEEHITNEAKVTELTNSLDEFKINFNRLFKGYDDINALENKILTDKYATKEQFEEVISILNADRELLFNSYTRFLGLVRQNTSEKEWGKIMKQVNKIID